MAYHHDDRASFHGSISGHWNPKQQEVIVIEDSVSPVPPTYHEPPANNTRSAANKRRRLPEVSRNGHTTVYGANHETLPTPLPARRSIPYEAYPYDQPPQMAYPSTDYPVNPSSSVAAIAHQYNYPYDAPDFRSSYNSPYNTRRPDLSQSGKRKRRDYDEYAYHAGDSRHATFTMQSSISSRQSRASKKNKEVVLRKEPDNLPNFTGRPYDDAEGHYIIVPNSELTARYQIDRLLGQGTFGKVVRAYDRHRHTWVAIKVIRAVQKYRDASMIELRVLRTLYENDPHNMNNCIHLQDCFDYRNHVCIVTELLNQSIFDFLKGNSFLPFPNSHIQHFAKQLFVSVAFLHELELIHTDLKPENILLVSNTHLLEPYNGRQMQGARTRKVLTNTNLRLIDFGSATFQDEYHSNVVSTRHYRAPEIILGMGWSFPCDIWSIGCILIEFFTGDALFQTHDNLEHLAMMEVVCGRIDGRIIRSASKLSQKMFRPSGRLDYPNRETSKDSRKFVKQMRSLGEMFPPISTFNNQFCDLLSRIFTYEPSARITAKQALEHPFFSPRL